MYWKKHIKAIALAAVIVSTILAWGALRADDAFSDEGNPYFAAATVLAVNTPDGLQTAFSAQVMDPNGSLPGSIASITVTAPGGTAYNLTATDFSAPYYYYHTISGLPAEGEYAFTVTDTENKSAVTYAYFKTGITIPLPDTNSFQAAGDLLTPTLSWSAVSSYQGNLFYRARIFDIADNTIWTSDFSSNTSAAVPTGILANGTSYQWRVEAFDGYQFFASGNRAYSAKIPLTVNSARPFFNYVTPQKRSENGVTGLTLEAGVVDPDGALPGSIASFVVTAPGGATYNLLSTDFYGTYYWRKFPEVTNPTTGIYAFTVTDTGGNSATSYDYMKASDIPVVDPATLQASGNPLAPVLSWGAPALMDRPLYFRARIYDNTGNSMIWTSNRIPETTVQVPSGILQNGVSYKWQVTADDASNFTHSSNQSRTPMAVLTINDARPHFQWAAVYKLHTSDGIYTAFSVPLTDPNGTLPGSISSLTVSGPGVNYTFVPGNYYVPFKEFYHQVSGAPTPGVYTFTVTDNEGFTAVTRDIVMAADDIPLPNESSFNISGDSLTPTVSWSGISGYAGRLFYRLRVQDSQGNEVYRSGRTPNTAQTVPAGSLFYGQTYKFRVEAHDHQTWSVHNSRANSVWLQYGTGASPTTITVSGIVKDWNGSVIPSGVTVMLVGDPTKTTTSSATDGSFSLPGVFANTSFSLKFSKGGYIDVYSLDITLTADANINLDAYGGSMPFYLPTAAELTAQGAMPASGKAVIVGRVSDQTYRCSSNIGGVVVTATGNNGKPYPVLYRDPFGVLQGSSTWGNGLYYVLNVDGGDTITINAAKSGWNFTPRTFHTQGDAVSMGRIWGTAPGYDASVSGYIVSTKFPLTPVPNATIELYGDPNKSTFAPSGLYTFNGLPKDANFYAKITASGFVPTYAGPANLWGSHPGLNIVVMTAGNMTNLGVTGSNGLIGATVTDPWGNQLSGATATLTSKSGTVYTVIYPDGIAATSTSGEFLVPDILPGDVVKIEVAKSGYAFNPVYLDGFSGAFTQTIISGTEIMVFNVHYNNGYYTALEVDIGNGFTGTLPGAISSINVTGPGGTVIATKPDLPYYPQWREFWAQLPGQPSLGEYRFELTGLSQTVTGIDNQTVIRNIPVPDKNTFIYTPGVNPTFSWGAVNYTEAPIYYRLVINDMAGNRIYGSSKVQDMLSQTIPSGILQTGQSYKFQVRVGDAPNSNLLQNESRSDYETFPRTTISYSFQVKTAAGAPLAGVTVSEDGNPNLSTLTDADGKFNLDGLTAMSNFYLKMVKEGYLPTYSARHWLSSNFTWDGRSFALFTSADTAGWPVNFANKGCITGRVSDSLGFNYIGGAVVTASSNLHPATPYVVTYMDDAGNFGGNATYGNGKYFVLNVDDGDIVTVTATKLGMTFNTRTFLAHAGGISLGWIYSTTAVQSLKGDLDGNGVVNLADLIMGLKVIAGMNPTGIRTNYPFSGADVNGDGKVGMPEAIFIMQKISGLRLNTASGTYTYYSGTLNLNWTSSDFQCEGPDLGAETKTGVTITSTTMTWIDDMTWNRSGGTAGDIVGTWTATDELGNSYTLTFNSDGTISVVGNIVQCESPVEARSMNWPNGYYVSLNYDDPNRTATSVSVTGPGITGSKSLAYGANWGSWNSWTSPSAQVFFGTTYPAGLPYTYIFSITDGTGTWTSASTVSCFQVPVASNLFPTGNVSGGITFNWTGFSDSNALYQVQLDDGNYNRIWNSPVVAGTSVAYTGGPALTSGTTYYYYVVVTRSSSCAEESFAQGSFTYN